MKTRALAVALSLTIAAVATATAFAVPNSSSAKPRGKPINIGLVVGLSGIMAPFDGAAAVGAQLAIEDVNAAGGVLGRPLKAIVGDTKSNPSLASTIAIQLINKGAQFVMVPCDFDLGGGAAALAAQQRKRISIASCAEDPKILVGNLAFTMGEGGSVQGSAMAEYAYNVLGKRRAHVVIDTLVENSKHVGEWARDRFGELAGKDNVTEDTMLNSDASFAAQISRIKALNPQPDVILYASFPPGGATFLRQLRGAGVDTQIVGYQATDGDYWLNTVPGLSNFSYTVFGSLYGDDPNPAVNRLFRRVKARTGKAAVVSLGPLGGYSVVQGLALAIRKAKSTDTLKVKKALETFRREKLIFGTTTFTSKLHQDYTRCVRIVSVDSEKPSYTTTYCPKKVVKPS